MKKTVITKQLIESLNPCQHRYDNYLKYYGDKELTIKQFLGRKNITQSDKLWVAFRLMSKENLILAVADIAESVLHIFESKYPKDRRPRKAIEAIRAGNVTAEVYDAAKAADDAADYAAYAADSAADAADYAAADYAASAANAAYTAANAAYTAASAASAAAAYFAAKAADAAAIAAKDTPKQQKLIRKIILKYWR